MKDLSFFTELTIDEQEKISGGTGYNSYVVVDPDGGVISQCGDTLTLPNGTTITDYNCWDDPIVFW